VDGRLRDSDIVVLLVVAQAIEATEDIVDAELSTFTRNATFDTVIDKVRFGKNGEWARPQVVGAPSDMASWHLIFPYADALQTGRP